ncbi:O-methyltransferase [Cellulomonas gelida]|uniref:O-methyltransferase n=1 Tax=Cellulomonas gelida TaxID=1712 RepID=A0A4Y3KE96_9CELL|nr:O-methyltransferase [Cellulomonas gelida]GEA82759.1 O-methyltransferase [Cellulomonas gelida]GGL33856.1 O-methyltransferase [Cellulomonas gelida]
MTDLTDPEALWSQVDAYFGVLAPEDVHLVATRARAHAAGLPDIAVAPNQGKFLQLLASVVGARRILEIGTLGGYSTLWLARALPSSGRLVTLELDPAHAAAARESLAEAGVSDRVDVVVGPASESLATLARAGVDAFDLVFIDADKQQLALYVDLSLALARPGTLVVVDNVVRAGAVVDAAHPDDRVQGVRHMVDLLTDHPRLDGTVIQTVGVKGYDGFALLRVTS